MLPFNKHFTPSLDALECRNPTYIAIFLADKFAVGTVMFSLCIFFIQQSSCINTDL